MVGRLQREPGRWGAPEGPHPRRAGTDSASTAHLDSLPLQRPLTTTCFLSGKQHQKWAMKSSKAIFTVDFYRTEKQCLCHLDISEKT